MVRRNNRNAVTYKLNSNISSWDQIDNLLENINTRFARADKRTLAKQDIELTDERLKMENYWIESTKKVINMNIEDTTGNAEKTIIAKSVVSHIERNHQNVWNSSKTNLKSHEDIVYHEKVDVIFYKIDLHFYVIFVTSDPVLIDHLKELIGTENIVSINIENSLFSWIYWKYRENDKNIDDQYRVPFITAFTGILEGEAEDDTLLNGKSADVSNLGAVDFHIAVGERLQSVGIQLEKLNSETDSPMSQLFFKFDNLQSLAIDFKQSIMTDIKYTVSDSQGRSEEETDRIRYFSLLIYLNAYIIPKLRNLYAIDEQNFDNELYGFRVRLANKILDDLIKHGVGIENFDALQKQPNI